MLKPIIYFTLISLALTIGLMYSFIFIGLILGVL